MLSADDRVVAAVAVIDQISGPGWTDTERRQEAVGLGAVVTDPLYPSVPLSWALACWAADRAARTEREWVRPGSRAPPSAWHFTGRSHAGGSASAPIVMAVSRRS